MLSFIDLLDILFAGITFITIYLFYRASDKNNTLVTGLIALAAFQAILGLNGFFLVDALPPRFLFLIGPGFILILLAFLTPAGRKLINRFDLVKYTYLHTIRVPVEFVLFGLFIIGTVPESMTFEGRNYDIFSGLSAPFIAYFGFQKGKLNNKWLLIWNIICLILVLQVVITGILSAPTPLQLWAYDQPNVGVFYFPFLWLPGIVVPIVIFGHLVAIRALVTKHH